MIGGTTPQAVLLTWIHVLAAVLWIGGMFFISFILLPVLKRGTFGADRRFLFQALVRRFRWTAWAAIFVLVVTGLWLLGGGSGAAATDGGRAIFKMKVICVAILLALTAMHDFWLGPIVGRLRKESAQSPSSADQLLIGATGWIGRISMALGIVILLLALAMTRVSDF